MAQVYRFGEEILEDFSRYLVDRDIPFAVEERNQSLCQVNRVLFPEGAYPHLSAIVFQLLLNKTL